MQKYVQAVGVSYRLFDPHQWLFVLFFSFSFPSQYVDKFSSSNSSNLLKEKNIAFSTNASFVEKKPDPKDLLTFLRDRIVIKITKQYIANKNNINKTAIPAKRLTVGLFKVT